jgi:hypothetical protein
MNKPALLLSLLALGALGLVACGGDDDEDSATEAKASAETTTATARPDTTTEAKPSREIAQEASGVDDLKRGPRLLRNLSREQVQELKRDANTEVKLSRKQVQELKREANEWARLFSRGGVCSKYTGQPICVRLSGSGPGAGVHAPSASAAFQKSFADATVEDIKSERIVLAGAADRPLYVAAVKFSNGEVVAFNGTGDESYGCAGAGSGCTWNIAEEDYNRRFLEAAGVRE